MKKCNENTLPKYLDEMIAKANTARENAYAPISKFPVGACLRSSDGKYYIGCNSENASFSLTICAESAAIASMVVAGDRKFTDIVVIAEKIDKCPPCGACRQRLYEFSDSNSLVYLCSMNGKVNEIIAMTELFTFPFSETEVSFLYN